MLELRLNLSFGKGGAVRDVAVLAFGTIISQLIIILATPLLSRVYLPAEFGKLAVFLAVSAVAATLITMRYETAILVAKRDDEAATLGVLALILAVIGSILLGVGGGILPSAVLELFGVGQLLFMLPVIFLMACASAFITVTQSWLNRKKCYVEMAKLRIFQSLGIVCFALVLGFMSLAYNGLLWAQALACIFTAIGSIWYARSAIVLWRPHLLWSAATAHINAPRYLLPTAVIDVVTMQMPVLLISIWFGEAYAGQFSMAWRMLMLPMAVVGAAVGQVFMQRLSQHQINSKQARRLLMQTWMLLLALGSVPLLIIFLFGEPVFSVFLGETWRDAGLMAATLSPLALAMFVSSPTSGSFVVLGIQKYSLWFGISVLIYRPLCIFLGYIYKDITLGLILWVLCELVQVFIYQLVAWKKMGDLNEGILGEKKA